MEQVLSIIYAYLATYGFKIVAALVIFVVGRWVARLISNLVKKSSLSIKTVSQYLIHSVTFI